MSLLPVEMLAVSRGAGQLAGHGIRGFHNFFHVSRSIAKVERHCFPLNFQWRARLIAIGNGDVLLFYFSFYNTFAQI
jgi:hypothetical protein